MAATPATTASGPSERMRVLPKRLPPAMPADDVLGLKSTTTPFVSPGMDLPRPGTRSIVEKAMLVGMGLQGAGTAKPPRAVWRRGLLEWGDAATGWGWVLVVVRRAMQGPSIALGLR